MNVADTKAQIHASTFNSEEEAGMRAALWVSLVSELRSKSSLMEAAGQLEKPTIDEPLYQEFTMTANEGFLSVWLNGDTGKGSWRVISKLLDMAEPWFLSTSGDFKLDGEVMNLSAAASRFIAKVSGQWIGPAST
ncbi:hypothetical protein [Tunturiibacter gelidiferens]|uniref:hypothetical protein n=1 Tax=Tunturiibacter gelidiferens TaxID=3069689 RepID=UPI003D9B482A